jgi:hypothetical protein
MTDNLKKILTAAAVVLGGIAAAGFLLLSGGTSHNRLLSAPCAQRIMIVDLSSESRGSGLVAETKSIASAAAVSSVVCGTTFTIYGVAGGGEIVPILNTDQLEMYAPTGPNEQVRSSRFTPKEQGEVGQLVSLNLRHAWSSTEPRTTSVEALYATAADYSSAKVDVVITTAGVNIDSTLNMNHPLDPGAGKADADRLEVAALRARSVTVVGVGQMDSTLPPPSTIWPTEIKSFNQTLCRRATTGRCRLYPAASATQALSANPNY